MPNTTTAALIAFVIIQLLNFSQAYGTELEDPNQRLWFATNGHCNMNTVGQETVDDMMGAMVACFNDGNNRGCDHEENGWTIIDDWVEGQTIGPYQNQNNAQDWGFDGQLVCSTDPDLVWWAHWDRAQCLDADELGENQDGEYGMCPERAAEDRLQPFAGSTCDPKDGNPCDAATGNKTIQETEFVGAGINLYLTWHSMAPKNLSPLGSRWMHSYGDFLDLGAQGTTPIGIVTPGGVYETLNGTTGNVFIATEGSGIRVHQSGNEFIAEFSSGERRYYDANGKLDRVESSPGQFTTISYNGPDNAIDEVVGQFGHTVQFQYSATTGKINRIVFPDGKETEVWHKALTNGNYPVATLKRPYKRYRDYFYEDANHPDFITGIENENNTRYATYAYDASGKAISTELTGSANKFTFTYNTDATVVTDGDGRVKTYNFENSPFVGKRHISTVRNGVTMARSYADATSDPTLRRLESLTDESGNVTQYGYNDHHRTTVTRAQGTSLAHTTTYEYLRPDSNKVTKIKRPSAHSANDAETTITYNSLDLPLTITESGYDSGGSPISRTTTFTYNSYGQVTSIDGPRTDVSDVTMFTYYNCATGNECGQLNTITNALGHTTTFNTYDANGRLAKETDPNGYVRDYVYDANNRWLQRIKVTTPTGYYHNLWYTWNNWGLVTSAPAGPHNSTLNYYYDNARRLIEVRHASTGAKIKYEYDSAGNVTEQRGEDISGTVKRLLNYAYDDFGRLDTINNAGAITDVLFDAIGNLDEAEDPLLNVTSHVYDALNRLTETIDANNESTVTAYNVHDMPTSVTAPNGVATNYIYDDLGNIESETSQDRGTVTYTHDAAGNVLTRSDGRSITATYTYDALNRVSNITYPTSVKNVTFGYDAGNYNKGLLTSMTDESGSTSWDHYIAGPSSNQKTIEKAQVTNGVTLTTKWIVNPVTGQPYKTVYPSGTTLTHYASTGLTDRMKVGNINLVRYVKYQPFGPPNQWRWSNGTYANFTYNQRGELTSAPMGSGLRTLTYDDAGNLATQADAEYSMSYGYDDLNRIDDFTATPLNGGTLVPGTQQFTYDENGNRESITEDSVYYNYNVSTSSNRINSTTGPVAKTYSYDLAGNVTADGLRTYVYDDRGRLESIDSGTSIYQYNGFGERVYKSTSSGTTLFVYGPDGELIGEYDGLGNAVQEFIWLAGRLIGVKQGGTTYYVHTDHLGTPRAVANGNTIVWRWDSDPFGSSTADEDPDGNSVLFAFNLRHPGQYRDAESGMLYNYLRTYDPTTGRYLESDPIGVWGD